MRVLKTKMTLLLGTYHSKRSLSFIIIIIFYLLRLHHYVLAREQSQQLFTNSWVTGEGEEISQFLVRLAGKLSLGNLSQSWYCEVLPFLRGTSAR